MRKPFSSWITSPSSFAGSTLGSRRSIPATSVASSTRAVARRYATANSSREREVVPSAGPSILRQQPVERALADAQS